MRTLILCSLLALPATAQDDSWTKEIDNSLVRVLRRQVEPRASVSVAEMPPALLVFLTDYSVQVGGPARQEELRGSPGQFLWHPGGRIGLENLSDHRLEVAQIVPKFGPALPPFTELEPSSALNRRRVEFENKLIRVTHPRVAAGQRIAERRDPTVVIHLSAAHIRFTFADGRVEEYQVKAGDIRFDAGGAFTFENLGEKHEVLRVELKAGLRDRN